MEAGYGQKVGCPGVSERLGQLRRHGASPPQQKGLRHCVLRLGKGLRQAAGQAVSQRIYRFQRHVPLALSHQGHSGVDDG